MGWMLRLRLKDPVKTKLEDSLGGQFTDPGMRAGSNILQTVRVPGPCSETSWGFSGQQPLQVWVVAGDSGLFVTHWEQGSDCGWQMTAILLRCCRDTAIRPVFLCLGGCEIGEGYPWERSGLPFLWLLRVWNHLSVEGSLHWEGLGSKKKLGSRSGVGRASEAWSYSWFCQVLTFQTLGLSINVHGASVFPFVKWKVIIYLPICISQVKEFHTLDM